MESTAVRVVAISKNGILLRTPRNDVSGLLHWSEILAVDVFKRDLFSIDLICLWLWRLHSDEPLEIDEEDPFWSEIKSALERSLPGIVAERCWFRSVAFPAFETNHQRIYSDCPAKAGDVPALSPDKLP